MKYSQEDIDLVKSKASIEDIVSSFIKLTKKGTDLIACCPFHNEKTPSFHVSVSKQMYKCFGCGKGGDTIQFLMEYGEGMSYIDAVKWLANYYNVPLERTSTTYSVPVFKNNTALSDAVIKWFEGRKIGQKTLIDKKITEGIEYMPQLEKDVNTIQFNYFRDGILINTKYRGPKKSFKLYKNAELIFYNIDSLKGKKEVFITEGCIDTLSLIEAGYEKDFGVISVPNGAHSSNNNLIYVDNCIDLFDNIEKIHIATDNDLPGRFLREQLAERFGKNKCDYIEFKDCKDANECLIKYGIQGVIDSCSNPINFPLEGVFNVSDFSWEVSDMYSNGLPNGVDIKLRDFKLRIVPGYITTITGKPGDGKSESVDEICIRLLVHHDWKGAFYSPENKPTQLHISKMARKLTGKHWEGENRITKQELNEVIEFIDKKIFFIKPEKDFTLTSILNQIKLLKRRYGLNYFVIDAWNKLEHKGNGDTDYISKALDELALFCESEQLHCFLVAHPTKIGKNKMGEYNTVTLYDISGCHDDQTEVLTERGFVLHEDLKKEDKVACFDLEKNTFSYMLPSVFHKYSFDGEMCYFKGYGLDIMVTPNHKMIVKPYYNLKPPGKNNVGRTCKYINGKWNLVEAKYLSKSPFKFPRTAEMNHSQDLHEIINLDGGYLTNDIYSLLGWYLSEGWVSMCSIAICQAAENYHEIKVLVNKIGLFYSDKIDNYRKHEKPMWKCRIKARKHPQLIKWIIENCGIGAKNKKFPQEIWGMSAKIKKSLLDTLLKGDGSRSHNGYRYTTISIQLANDVQKLCIELGYKATISSFKKGKEHHHRIYVVGITFSKESWLMPANQKKAYYNGFVYCLTVPTGAYITRRNGKTAITGNSAHFNNKTDNGITIHRDFERDISIWYRQKVKFGHWGYVGKSEYKLDLKSLRYYVEGYPETTNWITKKPIENNIQTVITNGDEPPF